MQDPLVLCVGPRRYTIRPIYSQHVRGGGKGVNNVHKSEKFLRSGGAVVATTFGPVCFGKTACLLLRDEGAGQGTSPTQLFDIVLIKSPKSSGNGILPLP
jgi:pre-rRNA-processing protein TSR1